MELTTQMRAEFETIKTRVIDIEEFTRSLQECIKSDLIRLGRISSKSRENLEAFNEELHTYKVRLENFLCETDLKNEQSEILRQLLRCDCAFTESNLYLQNATPTDDKERYLKMAMKIDSSNPIILESYGIFWLQKQLYVDPVEQDYGFTEYFRKSFENSKDPDNKEIMFKKMMYFEAKRDYYAPTLRPINHLIQIAKPNFELIETKWELYKISISFRAILQFKDVHTLKGSKHRVFFQNAEGNINLGIFFYDPDVSDDDIYWYNMLATAIQESLERKEGLISIDKELNTFSCYVELHSHPVGSNGRNNIIAVTPMKFLPIVEFEKRQKSINKNQARAILSSAMTKTFDVIENKKKATNLKEKGNNAFKKKKFEVAEKFYSDALQLNLDSRPIWTNRAICRNQMKKHEDALADCLSALSIDPKNTKTITQKGNALLGLSRFDEAKKCYESLRELGEKTSADLYLEKIDEIQKSSKPANNPCA